MAKDRLASTESSLPQPWTLPPQGLALFHGDKDAARLSHYAKQLERAGVKLRPGETLQYIITGAEAELPDERVRAWTLWEGWHGYDVKKYQQALREAFEAFEHFACRADSLPRPVAVSPPAPTRSSTRVERARGQSLPLHANIAGGRRRDARTSPSTFVLPLLLDFQ